MNNEEKILDLLETLVVEVNDVKAAVVRIENDHGARLGSLYDGYVQNSEKLDRIEREVSKHEEIIVRRVK